MKRKLLFNINIINKALGNKIPEAPAEHLSIIQDWQKKTEFGGKETNLDGAFISEFLCPILGYKGVNASGKWTIEKNRAVGSGNVDVAIGRFTKDGGDLIAPFELKGPKTKDLDAIMTGRHKTPVQQAWEYAMDAKGAQWVLVSNMLEIRLYAVGYGRQAYEVFYLKDLHQPSEYARFCLLLGAGALLEGNASSLLKASEQADKDITDRLYRDYKAIRTNLIHGLQQHNKGLAAEDAITFSQTILDRVLFIAFAEDTRLLPVRSLADAYEAQDDYSNMTVWERFVALFNWVDKGLPKRKIPPYNGGLFKRNSSIDRLSVPDDLCEGFKKLGEYDFASEISVNILGHIFEQSITDLEEIKASIDNSDYDAKQGKRKKYGIVYTPDYITRYIVEQAVGGCLEDRRKALGFYTLPTLDSEKDYPTLITHNKGGKGGKVRKVRLQNMTTKAKKHLAYWQAYKEALSNIKIIDPACGSGAFLVQTFDYLLEEGQRVNAEIARLQGGIENFLERLDTQILKNNLYGVDLNPESVEITKLSLWLKTASSQEKLTYLDDNIQCGNSIVADSSVQANAFNWNKQFADILKSGGFDVVVGNPPYVRMELLKSIKPYLEKNFITATDRADLFIYFYEKGINLLKPNGWLGYISNRTFFKTGSGSELRRLLSKEVTLQRVVDFGDRQIFEGATTYPAILILTNAKPDPKHEISFTVVTDDVVDFVTLEEQAPTYPQKSLGEASWQLEQGNAADIRAKITKHQTLKEAYGSPMYGIKTGLNEAFVVDRPTRDRIVKADPKAAVVLKPFLEGKDFQKWHIKPRDLYLINIPRDQINIEDYPSIHAHLAPYRKTLEKRATRQKWYELQQAQMAYQPHMIKPKIIYGHFCPEPIFSIDAQGFYSNNKSYFIPNADWYLLALLNSTVLWTVFTGMTTAVRGGYYEATAQHIEKLPIPQATAGQKSALGELAQQCQHAAEARYKAQQEILRRIPDLAPNPASAKLSKKLQSWWDMDFQAFRAEVKKVFKKDIPIEERNGWESMLTTHRQQVIDFTSSISSLEEKINQQVYDLFKLTSKEVKVIQSV